MQSRYDMNSRELHDNYFLAVWKVQETLARRPLAIQLAVVPPLNMGEKGCGDYAE